MEDTPLVSIIINNYNYERFLKYVGRKNASREVKDFGG